MLMMLSGVFGRNSSKKIENHVAPKPPAEELDEMLHQAIEEWKLRHPSQHHTDALECWIVRNNKMEGMQWVVRLQSQQPMYDVGFRKI
jgi:hypothetical protein